MSVTADQHFAIIPEWVLYADISANAVRLYGVLRRYADKAGKAHPSRATLAEGIRVKSVRTVDAALTELEEAGAVTTTRRHDGRQFLSSVYLVHSAPPSAADSTTPSAPERANLVQQAAHEPEPENERNLESRKRDVLFDALCTSTGIDYEQATKSQNRATGVAAAEIRTAWPGIDDLEDVEIMAEVATRAYRFSRDYPGAKCTPNALARHWGALANTRIDPRSSVSGADEAMDRWVGPNEPMSDEEWAETMAARDAAFAERGRSA